MNGAAQAGISQLYSSGELDVLDARGLLSQEIAASNVASLLSQDLAKETATGGNNALENQIGQLLGAGASGGYQGTESAIQAVEAAATASGRSVDQALVNLSQGAGVRFEGTAEYSIATEESNRISSGAAAADLASRVEAGTMTDTKAAAIMAAEGAAARATTAA